MSTTHQTDGTMSPAETAQHQHGGVPPKAPEKFREALRNALGRNVHLAPMDLPPGCSAAWFGGIKTDRIGYARNTRAASFAVAHAAGHLSLLHCGRIRDGGRFACADTHHKTRNIVYRLHMLLGEDDDLPSPLFTTEEEQAASAFAVALLTQCGCRAEVPAPRSPGEHQTFQCLG